ncbi:hypothetical protein, partial [Acidithiobacillus ferrivorans]
MVELVSDLKMEKFTVLSDVWSKNGKKSETIRIGSFWQHEYETAGYKMSDAMRCAKIWNRPFRCRLWWAYRSDDVWRNLGCTKQAGGGVILSGMAAWWGERNLGDVGRAAWVPSKLRSRALCARERGASVEHRGVGRT